MSRYSLEASSRATGGGADRATLADYLERQTMRLRAHAHEHGQGQDEIDARCPARNLACRRLLLIGRRHDPEDFLLVRPDEDPHVEQHDRSEPGAYPQGPKAGLQRKGKDDGTRVAEPAQQVNRSRHPGDYRGPAEPQERPRRDVLRDTAAAGSA